LPLRSVVASAPSSTPASVTKYQTASTIVGKVLEQLIPQIEAGKTLVELCSAGDKLIDELVATVYNKKGLKITKGIAFPTAISVNNAVSHVSPLANDESFAALADGDVVKVQLGVHIDGVSPSPLSRLARV
jgi:methionine aminopeptidase